MHTECAEVGSNPRKYYRFYIGQGIPDPWLAYPASFNSKLFSPSERTTKKHHKQADYGKGPCICSQKEYLFECPDKCASKSCSYTDGHSKNTIPAPQSDDKCRCNDIYQTRGLVSSPNESSSESENEPENLNGDFKNPPLCECFITRKTYSSSSEKSGFTNGESEKPLKLNMNYKTVKGNRKICFCPFVRQFCARKPSENEGDKSFTEHKTVVSKEIQTDSQLTKNSKTVQTEKQASKSLPKCTCANKYLTCNFSGYKQWSKRGCQPIYSIPNVCCASSLIHNPIHNPALACPYSFMNHFTFHKCDRHDNSEVKKYRSKKKQPKERENEEDSNADLETNQAPPDENYSTSKGRAKWESFEIPKETAKGDSKNFYYHQPTKSYDQIKYEDKLNKSYPPGHSSTMFSSFPQPGSKLFGFPEGDSLLQGTQFERFKSFSNSRPTPFESPFLENKFKFRGNNRCSSLRPSYFSDESKLFGERSQKNNVITNPSEGTNDYNDRGNSGLAKTHTKYTKVLRKRRKYLASEKRRKIASGGNTYQGSLNELPKHHPEVVQKETEIERNPQDYVKNLEKIYHAENFNSSSGLFIFDKNSQTRVKEPIFYARQSATDAIKRV